MRIQSDYSHTISGLFWFDLPLGILLTLLYHNIVRNSLIKNLPFFFKARLFRFTRFDWNQHFKAFWPTVVISILIGSASHLLWDAFTHKSGHFVATDPDAYLRTVDLFGGQVPMFKILQHSSTFIGGLIILLALIALPSDPSVNRQTNFTYWLIVFALTFAVVFVRILFGLTFVQYGHLVATTISAGLVALTVTPLIVGRK